MGDSGLIRPIPVARSRRVALSSSSGMVVIWAVRSWSCMAGRDPGPVFLFGVDFCQGVAEVGLGWCAGSYAGDGLFKLAPPPGQLGGGEFAGLGRGADVGGGTE